MSKDRVFIEPREQAQSIADEAARADILARIDTLESTQVSENAGSLYQRYVEAEEQLAVRGAEVAEKCAVTLKNNCAPPKK
jgi:hypothetical protein